MLQPDIRGLQRGDEFMWGCAYHWLWPLAWSAARRRLEVFSPSEIEDVAIIAIKEAAEEVQAGNVESFEELKAITTVIADRRALDHIRRRQAERRAASATETIEGRDDLVSTAPGLLEEVDVHDVAKLLMELAGNLPDQQRQLLEACYVHGLKQTEIAEKFGMPMGTVGVTLSRALESLRKELQKYPQLMKELLETLR